MGIPRYKPYAGPALFRQGFRPFFLAAGLWSAIALALWLATLAGTIPSPTGFAAAAWHAHEMLFGFVVAAISGFLLTAIPNWTGRMPLQGGPLIGLFALWFAGRVAMLVGDGIGRFAAALVDLAYLVALIVVVGREIAAGRNWRNLPMPFALGLLLCANGLMHAEFLDLAVTAAMGERLAIATVVMLISLIGGRIVPSFTRNWLMKRGASVLPAAAGAFDAASLALTALALAAWVAEATSALSGAMLVAAGFIGFSRLARWCGHRTLSEPLVWSLHLGFLWVPVGLCLLGLGLLWPHQVSPTAGLHALTAGAIGGMTLAVMTRATLGHTGRPLAADVWTAAIYALVAVAAAGRVIAAFDSAGAERLLSLSGFLWVSVFVLFVLRYGRILIGR